MDQLGPSTAAVDSAATPKLEITCSRQLPEWLAEQKVALAFTTYQSAKLFLIGLRPDRRLSVSERTFSRCMGLWGSTQTLWMSSLYQLWRFENVLSQGEQYLGHDGLYVPQVGYTTGDLDIHDIAVDAAGRPLFVATLFGCLATTSETHSFTPIWRPPFISKLAAEDRCHLNGLAMRDGAPAYVSALAATDVADSWREHRRDGGVVVDATTNETVCSGLSMPHSPRLHDGTLYVLNSGTGYFGRIDPQRKTFEPIAFCPGYLRGLAFAGRFAVVGLSRPRAENKTFAGLELGETLAAKNVSARCGILVIDLKNGDIVHWLSIQGVVEELYDVAVLPSVVRPTLLGFKSDEIRRVITIGVQSSGTENSSAQSSSDQNGKGKGANDKGSKNKGRKDKSGKHKGLG
jgi:uncharacterized protein (TIGR03032 family)